MYKLLVFDLDGTLMDFEKTSNNAFDAVFEYLDIKKTDEHINKFNENNQLLWSKYEKGIITMNTLRTERFSFMDRFSNKEISLKAEKIYEDFLGENVILMENSLDVLEKLKGNFNLSLATNGSKEIQYKRILKTGIEKYFENIFISEEVGYSKPSQKFFNKICEKYEDIDKSKILMIGDSLDADMQGAINSNIGSCWFNNKGITNNKKLNLDFEISKLTDLFKILD